MKILRMLAITALLLTLPGLASAQIQINEIRIDNTGADTDEYFELIGDNSASLDGLTYIVIGDGSGGSGVIESVTDLTGLSLMSDGLLAVHKEGTTGTCGSYDAEMGLNFENSDNVTHLLVAGFTGANGDDLDLDDNGSLDVIPWTSTLDGVALVLMDPSDPAFPGGSEWIYTLDSVGPDGTFVPGHVVRCVDGWEIGAFATCTNDSPGEPNLVFCDGGVPSEPINWGGLKSLYR